MNKLLTFVFPVFLLGQFDQVANGFGLDIGSSGSGMFIMRNYVHASEILALNGELRFYDIKAEDETIVYDYYTGQYKSVGGKSLVMLPVFIGGNYYPFVGKIENNFSPFIAIKGGVVTTVNGEEFGTFSERWKNPDIQYTSGGFFGVGIDFKIVGQSSVMVMVGLEYLPLKKETDGKNDYSGFLIHLSFNRRAK
ncbi:MAG: hypothetical protein HOA05_05870 [Candidatus Marinimicrobia bacterium]|jgi:hypothetical protein|nr:hypothetical protein [Candidatus Neomarinimicrobiota bacterium]